MFEICMGFGDIDPTSKVKGWLKILYFSKIEAISYVSVKESVLPTLALFSRSSPPFKVSIEPVANVLGKRAWISHWDKLCILVAL